MKQAYKHYLQKNRPINYYWVKIAVKFKFYLFYLEQLTLKRHCCNLTSDTF